MMSIATTDVEEWFVSTLADDPDLGEIVELFVTELPGRIAQLADCLAGGDWETLKRYAHQMKGAAGSYGFHQLTPAAARLETAASLAEDEQATRAALEELTSLCQRVRAK